MCSCDRSVAPRLRMDTPTWYEFFPLGDAQVPGVSRWRSSQPLRKRQDPTLLGGLTSTPRIRATHCGPRAFRAPHASAIFALAGRAENGLSICAASMTPSLSMAVAVGLPADHWLGRRPIPASLEKPLAAIAKYKADHIDDFGGMDCSIIARTLRPDRGREA